MEHAGLIVPELRKETQLALREFTFQGQTGAGPQLGFVGGNPAAGLGPLGRRGMRLIGRLDDAPRRQTID